MATEDDDQTPAADPAARQEPPRLMPTSQAAVYLGIPPYSLLKLVHRGDVRYHRVGRNYWFDQSALDELVSGWESLGPKAPAPRRGAPAADPADARHAASHFTELPAHVESPLWTVEQAAEYLTVSDRTMRRYVAQGRLAFYRVGRELRFKQKDLDRYLEGLRQDVIYERRRRRGERRRCYAGGRRAPGALRSSRGTRCYPAAIGGTGQQCRATGGSGSSPAISSTR